MNVQTFRAHWLVADSSVKFMQLKKEMLTFAHQRGEVPGWHVLAVDAGTFQVDVANPLDPDSPILASVMVTAMPDPTQRKGGADLSGLAFDEALVKARVAA